LLLLIRTSPSLPLRSLLSPFHNPSLSFNIHATHVLTNKHRLTQGAFVLVSGRVGSVFGTKNVIMAGGVWWILWSFINGFCIQSLVPFAIVRALSGVGAALVMPNVVAGIGTTWKPGDRGRNLSFGLLGFGAPVGGTTGFAILAVLDQFAGHWRWFFFIL
jgi:MFS family permease